PQLPGERIQRHLPRYFAPQWTRGQDSELRDVEYLSCGPDAVLSRPTEEHPGRRRHAARQHPADLRIADGRLEPAQPQTSAVFHGRPRERRAERRGSSQGAQRHAAGQRDARRPAITRISRHGAVRRQRGRIGPERRMSGGPNTMLAMASMLEAIEIKRKTYFEYEGAPYH